MSVRHGDMTEIDISMEELRPGKMQDYIYYVISGYETIALCTRCGNSLLKIGRLLEM